MPAVAEKHDATGVPSTTGYMHGPGGLLTWPGVDPDVFSTIVGQRPSILNSIPTRPTVFMNPTFEILTGIGAGSGDEPETVCDDAPIGGALTAGIVTAPFGRYMRQTKEIDIGRMGQRHDRSDPVDLRIVGQAGGGSTPWTSSNTPGNLLVSEIAEAFWERNVAFDLLLRKQIWTGNPQNNNGGGGYKEFAGLNLQINTVWRDAITGQTLASLAPDVRDFALKNVDAQADDLVQLLTNMYRNRQDLAEMTGVAPVRYAFVMRRSLYYEVTKSWPCAYGTTMCSTSGSDVINQNRQDLIDMRDDMRNRNYLLIDGEEVPVMTDDAIPFYTNTTKNGVVSGCQSSDIYLIPFSIGGGRSVLYLDYFDFDNGDARQVVNDSLVLARSFAAGAFLEVADQTKFCLKWQARVEPRLVFRTPWLAGRLTNIQWCPLQEVRQSFPTDPYNVVSAAQVRPGPSLFQPWTA